MILEWLGRVDFRDSDFFDVSTPGTRDFFEKIIYLTFYLSKIITLKMDMVEMCRSDLFALFKIRIAILLLILFDHYFNP
jgi:hypothetical protein